VLIESSNIDGNVVQTGSITGDVHPHHVPDVAKPPVPRQLQPPSRHLVARAAGIDHLADPAAHVAAPTVALVDGPGGVGKTTPALQGLRTRVPLNALAPGDEPDHPAAFEVVPPPRRLG